MQATKGVDAEKLPEMQAIAALIRKGEIQTARSQIAQYLRTSNGNPAAFYLLSMVEPDPSRQVAALERALSLDPYYERARKRLASIGPAAAPTPEKPPRRNILPALLVLIVIAGIVGVGGYLFVQSKAGENAFVYVCQMDGLDKESKLSCTQLVAEFMGTPVVGAAVNTCASTYNVYLAENQRKSFTVCVGDKSGISATANIILTNVAATLTQAAIPPTRTPYPTSSPVPPTATVSPADRERAKALIVKYCGTVPGLDCDSYIKTYLGDDKDVVNAFYCAAAWGEGTDKFGRCIKDLHGMKAP